jgi:hypothetical protein
MVRVLAVGADNYHYTTLRDAIELLHQRCYQFVY